MDTSSYPRKIYIDLGIKDFESSICWIMQHYPAKFDQIYAFECARDFTDVETLTPNVERCIQGTSTESIGHVDAAQVVDSMSLYYDFVGVDSDPSTSPPAFGLGQFSRDIEIQEENFVVRRGWSTAWLSACWRMAHIC